jgi:hypothetical protein
MNEVLGQRTRSELRIIDPHKFDGLGLIFGVLCIGFGKFGHKAKGHKHARVRFSL